MTEIEPEADFIEPIRLEWSEAEFAACKAAEEFGATLADPVPVGMRAWDEATDEPANLSAHPALPECRNAIRRVLDRRQACVRHARERLDRELSELLDADDRND